MKLTAKNFTECSEEELRMVLDWRNSADVAQNSFNNTTISWQRHIEFVNILKTANDKAFFLVSDSVEHVGVISLRNIDGICAEVGYYKNPCITKKGVGVLLLDFAAETAKNTYNLCEITTRVISGNIASEKSIERAGFAIVESNVPYSESGGRQFLLNVYKRVL